MAADKGVIRYCRHVSRPYMFSASMPPSNVAAVIESLNILKNEPERMERLHENAEYMKEGYRKIGVPFRESKSPIIAIDTYTTLRTFKITKALLESGVYVNPVLMPAVPEGQAILRTSYTATHTKEQLDYALEGFDRVFNELYPVTPEELEISVKSYL